MSIEWGGGGVERKRMVNWTAVYLAEIRIPRYLLTTRGEERIFFPPPFLYAKLVS